MYIKNNNANIVLYDVDDTLVFFDPLEEVEPIEIKYGIYTDLVYPNYPEIAQLKRAKVRGHYVRVHSQGGQEWAEAAVIALGLQDYVDSIECKPKWFHDDLEWNSFCTRFYTKPKMKGSL